MVNEDLIISLEINWDMIPISAVSNLTLISGATPLFGLNSLGGALSLELKTGFSFEDTKIDSSKWTFDLGTGAPSFTDYGISSPNFIPDNFPSDNFSVLWEGKIKIDYNNRLR